MKTVRLPIYENGVTTDEMLEVDLTFFLSSTRGLRSNQARVLQPQLAQWEIDLLTSDEVFEKVLDEHRIAKEEVLAKFAPPVEEWRIIEHLPTESFEINRDGVIRIRTTQKVMEPAFDVDNVRWAVRLIINRQPWWIHGPNLAEKMWSNTNA